jgi:hypothetical protein
MGSCTCQLMLFGALPISDVIFGWLWFSQVSPEPWICNPSCPVRPMGIGRWAERGTLHSIMDGEGEALECMCIGSYTPGALIYGWVQVSDLCLLNVWIVLRAQLLPPLPHLAPTLAGTYNSKRIPGLLNLETSLIALSPGTTNHLLCILLEKIWHHTSN